MMNRTTVFLWLYIVCASGLTAQNYVIDDPEKVLTQKEKQCIEKAIGYEIDFYNKVFPDDTLIKISDVKLMIFSKYVDYISYEATKVTTSKFGMYLPDGYFSSQTKEVVMHKSKSSENFLSLCYHELSHFFFHEKIPYPPAWLDEGLACYFESMNISAKAVKFEKRNRYITQVKTMIKLKEVNIADCLSWDQPRFKQMTSYGYSYAMAYCMVYLLFQKDENMLINVMRDIRKGQSSAAAIEQHYSGGLEQFEKDFFAYFK